MSAKAIHLRIFMYILTIVLHSTNALVTIMWVNRILEDPQLQYYYPFWTRLFTVWTVIMLLVHATIGLYCDTISLCKYDGKAKRLFNNLKSCNNTFFSAIVWPSCWACSSLFWFFYFYDDTLLCISLLRKLGNPITNHIGHTFPLISILWEALLQPRAEPKSHKRNVALAMSFVVLYIVVLSYTFVTSGTFIYPFYDVAYGTIYFPLIHLMTFVLTIISYYAQWPISRLGNRKYLIKVQKLK